MLDAGALNSLVGYTAIGGGMTGNDIQGNDGEIFKLDNGMIFELSGSGPRMDSYSPEVLIFERILTPAQAKELGIEGASDDPEVYTS